MDTSFSSCRVYLLIVVLFFFGHSQAFAQRGSVPVQKDTQFFCGTDAVRDFWVSRSPEVAKSIARMDSILALRAMVRMQTNGPIRRPQNTNVFFIPVVFHIVHQGGAENISDAQIMQGIEWINDGLRNRGAAYKPDGVDLMIELCAAERDTAGRPTSPITRQSSALTDITMETEDGALKDLARWDPARYLNVWVVREISSTGMGSGVAAYATLPFAAGTPMDGIVTESRWVGGSAAGTTVMVHELGHYFGLWHTFQGGCGNNNCLQDGDKVCDTPPDGTTQASKCDNPQNSCASDIDDSDPRNPFRNTSIGGKGDVADMVTNFMDYGDLACMTRFTPGQDIRMHDAILEFRQPLLASAACIPTCTIPPEVTFTPGDTSVFIQTELTFANNSEEGLTFKWLINDVVVSEDEVLTYTFSRLGLHTVTLIGYRYAGTDSMCAAKFETIVEVTVEIAKDFEWTLVTPGLHPDPNNKTTDGALSIGRDGSVWTSFKNVSRSLDGGVSWSTTVELLPGWFGTPCIDAFDSTYAIATTVTPGAYFTRDGGVTWKSIDGPGAHTYACSFLGDTNRMIFTATTLNADMKSVVSLTIDGGETWNHYDYPEGELLGIEYLGNDVLIGAARINLDKDEASIILSTDLGRTWSKPVSPSELGFHAWGLASDPCDSTRIVIVANKADQVSDMWSTTDMGRTAVRGIPPQTITLAGSVRNGGRVNGGKYLYAHSLDAGVLMSTDHGISWRSIGGPSGRSHSWLFDVVGDTLIYAMNTQGDVWRAKRINNIQEPQESRHDRISLTIRDVRTDTVGGTVWLPIQCSGATLFGDLSFRLTFDPELAYKGGYDKDGGKIPAMVDQEAGFAILTVPANKFVQNGNTAYIEFEMALGGGRVFAVEVDSIRLLSPKLPAMPQCKEFVYTYEGQGSAAVTIGPEGCGTEVLGNFVRKGKLPSLRITPNPANEQTVLTSDAMLDDVTVRVISTTGIVKIERSVTFAPGKPVRLDTYSLEKGAYQIILLTNKGQLITSTRLVKQ